MVSLGRKGSILLELNSTQKQKHTKTQVRKGKEREAKRSKGDRKVQSSSGLRVGREEMAEYERRGTQKLKEMKEREREGREREREIYQNLVVSSGRASRCRSMTTLEVKDENLDRRGAQKWKEDEISER